MTGDVTDRRAVRRAVEGVERVFHVAAETSLDDRDRELVFAVNVGGTKLVADEALAAGVSGSSTLPRWRRSAPRQRAGAPTRRSRS